MTNIDSPPATAAETWLDRVEAAERAGDLLHACDLAASALREHPTNSELQYREVLNLARAGALTRAKRLWKAYQLPTEDLRFASLEARLLRDHALRQGLDAGKADVLLAARAYAEIFRRTGRSFPGTNAAALFRLGGDASSAAGIAKRVIQEARRERPATANAAFNLAADLAAAHLILRDDAEVQDAVALMRQHAGNQASLASTRRQLSLLCGVCSIDVSILDPLRPKATLHFTGHMIGKPGAPARFPSAQETTVAADIGAALDKLDIGAGFGSLASGSDILVAEALLTRGATVHILLPMDQQAFVEHSVLPAGEAWVPRFNAVLERAASVSQATDGPYFGDAAVFAYTSRLAMGLARLHAKIDEGPCHQLAVWDGIPTNGVAGTGADVALWSSLGLQTTIISSRPAHDSDQAKAGGRRPAPIPKRQVRTFLFGDFKGFGELSEQQLLLFSSDVLPAIARAIEQFGAGIEWRNTWGDGLYLIIQDVDVAAACAQALQKTIAALDLSERGLPRLGLRLALHAGPVFAIHDPIIKQSVYTGRHISRTARIERVTPEGEVYVSEAFAALLALQGSKAIAYEYVGRLRLPKSSGVFRMYLLTDTPGSPEAAKQTFSNSAFVVDPWSHAPVQARNA